MERSTVNTTRSSAVVLRDEESRNLNKRYTDFLTDGNLKSTGSVDPRYLHQGVCALNQKYRGLNQEDGPELFRYFMDGLIEGELKVMKETEQLSTEKTSFKKIEAPSEKVFGNYLANRVTCIQCDYISWTFHMTLDLNIDIDKDNIRESRTKFTEEKETAHKVIQTQDEKLKALTVDGHYCLEGDLINFKEDVVPYFNPLTQKLYAPLNDGEVSENQTRELTDLLDNFFRRELLNNVENYYTCYGCNKKKGEPKKGELRFITKTFFLYYPGPVLAITLKRFKKSSSSSYFSSFSSSFSKIDTQVNFPAKLNLDKYYLSKLSVDPRN